MSTLPALSTLSPPEEESKQHPPIYLSLNSHIVDELRQRAQAFTTGKASRPEFTINFSDGSASVHLDDLIFAGSQTKESNHVEIFMSTKKTSDTFKSCGRIGDHVVLKPEKPVKSAEVPKVDSSHPILKKVVHLLAAKPQSIASLMTRIAEPEALLSAILTQVSVHHKKRGVFELKDEYRSLSSQRASRQSSTELKSHLVSPDSSDHLLTDNYASTNPPFKKTTTHSPPSLNSRPSSPFVGLSPPLSDEAMRANSAEDTFHSIDRTRKRKISPTHQNTPLSDTDKTSRFTNDTLADIPKRTKTASPSHGQSGSNDEDTDLLELARKFRDRYSEYRELYSALQDRSSRPPKQLQRLMTMHRQLALWKEKLWSSSRSKQVN